MKEKKVRSLKTTVVIAVFALVSITFALTVSAELFMQTKHGKTEADRSLTMLSNEKAAELEVCFTTVENAVRSAEAFILKTIDERRILSDAAYEARYMEMLTEQMTTFTGLPKSVTALYFRMEIERFGGKRGIFLNGSPKTGFITVANTDLRKYSPTDTEHVGWYYIPVWKKAPVWTAPYLNKNINVHMISYIIPVYKKGMLLGVVGMDINLAAIKSIIDSSAIDNALNLLIGAEGNLVYCNKMHESHSTVEQTADISAMLDHFTRNKDEKTARFKWNGESHTGMLKKLENGMTLIVSMPDEMFLRERLLQGLILLSIFVLLLLVAWLVNGYAITRLVAPLREMSNATFKISRGEMQTRITYESNNELGLLADNIRKMNQQIKEYIAYIREQTKQERIAKEAAEAANQSKSEFLASMYLSMHEIDLTTNTFKPIQSRDSINKVVQESIGNANDVLHAVMQKTANKQSWDELLPFVDLSSLQERMQNRITIAHEFLGISGIWCRGRFIAMDKNKDGSLHHVLWTIENINEERAAREKLRQEAERSKAEAAAKNEFLASLYHSLHEIDLNNDTFQEINSRADVKKIVGTSWKNARATVRRVMEERVQNQGQARKDFMDFINFDTLDERLKGKLTIAHEFYSIMGYWCRARFIAMDRNPDGTLHHILYAVEDVNEEREERERLQGEVAKSIAASQAKSAFLANMSHEIRTPINAVLGMDEMILRECDDDTILGYAANIKTAGANLLAIINDILDFSKIEAGKMELISENYDISSVVVDLVNMISERAKKKNLDFKLVTNPELPKTLYGDSVRIKQCILNLLTNAVKYTKEGSITFSVDFKEIDHNLIKLKVSVTDTGSGIKKEDMERLFRPFERIEEDKNKTIEGTGLGMSIVKKILDMMHTKLEVESEYGKGSTFSFAVEQTVVDWTEAGNINETYQQSIATMTKYTEKLHAPKAHLLFVDDTEMNLEVVKGLLKKTGIKLDTVLSGKAALEKVQENEYDILFIDHRMPEMDGIQTLHAMQKLDENKSAGRPCIALTANAMAGVKQMYLDEGFTDYLSKPVDPVKLELMIRKYLPLEKIETQLEEDEPYIDTTANDKAGEPAQAELLEKLRAVDGLDAETALANCGTPEVLVMSLEKYYTTIDEKAAELTELLESGDWENYGTKVHSLKSTSRLIGLTELGAQAEHLEHTADAALSDDAEAAAAARAEIQEKHPPLIALLKDMKTKLAPLAEQAADAGEAAKDGKPELSADELGEKMAKLLALADDFDIDGLDALIAELSAAHLPENFTETFKKIRTSVENVDFSELKNVLTSAGFSA